MAQEVSEAARETVDSELIVQHPKTIKAGQSGHAAFIPKCITDKKYPLAVTLVVTVLLIVIIALAVRKPQPCSPCPPLADAACPQHWIGYHGKCYYKSEDDGDWNSSETKCSTFGATLALIDSQWDLSFLVNMTRPVHHWIGLSRQTGLVWKWQNGTEFEDQFLVRGDNVCAYLDNTGVSSTRCSLEKNFLCSQPDACSRKRKTNLAGKDM
ncbi:C-type lectin domain family 2 member D-like isoform X1 [Heteronotia binoei]|uniref:C-type lectin domain family 2 member D-like isoform X1 n=1 Tax=Heteronotia binoei TaxID=13085 RepID=UPI00292EFCE2|nr:C-type lectin domain family 2 member D-like isoform X1 [Heteronotia binoei]